MDKDARFAKGTERKLDQNGVEVEIGQREMMVKDELVRIPQRV